MKSINIKIPKNKPYNWSILKPAINFMAMTIAYICLIMLASYGSLKLLEVLNDTIKIAITTIFILLIVFIIFNNKKYV